MKKNSRRSGKVIAFVVVSMSGHHALAQQSKQEALSDAATVVVSGTRSSLAAAVDLKKNAVQFVDTVIADDIGKLPDTNVAESLARVSGVQLSQGIGGEGTSITIRGSRDNVTLFNGRQVIDVAGRGGQGQDTLGSTSYGILSLIPSELVGRLEVTKLPGADEIEGGLGGIVNIVTRRPLDLKKSMIAGSIEGAYRDFGSKYGSKVSVLYADVSTDKTFGALVNLVAARTPIQEDNFSSFLGYQPLTAGYNTANLTGTKADNNGDGVPGSRIADLRYQTLTDDRRRLGGTVSLQWKPRADVNLYTDVSYMKTTSERDRRWLAVPVSGSGSDWLKVTMRPDDYIVSGTELTRLSTNYEHVDLESTLLTSAVGGSWRRGDLTAKGELAYSESKGAIKQWAGAFTTINRQTVSFDLVGSAIPSTSIAGLNLADPAQFVWTSIQENERPTRSSDKAARFDLTYAFDGLPLSSLQAGGRLDTVFYDTQPSNAQVASTAGSTVPGFNTPLSVKPNLVSLFSPSSFVPGASVPGSFLTPNQALTEVGCHAFDGLYNAAQIATCTPGVVAPLSASTVEEKTRAIYLKANIDTELLGYNFEGNVGVRYVQTDLTSQGFTRYNKNGVATISRNTIESSRKDVLPSMVMKWSLPRGVVLRGGAASVIARPASSLLNSSFTVNESLNAAGATVYSASGGAPMLKPYEVNQYDVAAEWYFGKKDLLALGLFYKDVNTYFVSKTGPEIVDGVNNNQPINVTRTVNGTGATIKGVELNYQQGFDFLPEMLRGFGSQFTFSHIKSETPTIDPTTKLNLPLPGLAKNNANIVLYYEKGPFGARIAYNMRSAYFDSIGANGAGIFYDDYSSLALSSYLQLSANMKLTVAGSNLRSEPVRIYAGKREYVKQYSLAKPIITINLSARF